MIVLLGPNGCGKSSLFDAFQRYLKVDEFYGMSEEFQRYYRRTREGSEIENEEVKLTFYGDDPALINGKIATKRAEILKKSLYMRSAYRHDSRFQNTSIEQVENVLNRHTVRQLIDTDRTVQDNYKRIIWKVLNMALTPNLDTNRIIVETIGDVQDSMKAIFGDLFLDALVSAQETGTFTFSKGTSNNFLYENLSAGEKAVFDLLLDIVVNKISFDDSLYCIDEPEAHISTKIQGKLLKELYRLIPNNCQLWLATHSIGMVRTAQEICASHPNQVVFLDMGFTVDGELRNYDQPQVIKPANPDYKFWTQHYTVALDDMATLLAPDCIVLCEGSGEGDDSSLDECCYRKIFAQEFPRTLFISVGAKTKVERRMGELLPVLEKIVKGTSIIQFRDRDDLLEEEIQAKKSAGIRVMSNYRNIESLLLSDGILFRLCESKNMPDKFSEIQTARNKKLASGANMYAPRDLKPAAQAVHHAAKNELRLPHPGETAHAFMCHILAPLVKDGTKEYAELKRDIFDK